MSGRSHFSHEFNQGSAKVGSNHSMLIHFDCFMLFLELLSFCAIILRCLLRMADGKGLF